MSEVEKEATITVPNPLKFLDEIPLKQLHNKEIEVTIKLKQMEKEQ